MGKYFQLSQFVLADGALEDSLVMQAERYENIDGLHCGDQVSCLGLDSRVIVQTAMSSDHLKI